MGASGNKPKKKRIDEPEMMDASKSICKVTFSNKISSGFLIKFFKNDKEFFCLITVNSMIDKEIVKRREKINIYYDNDSMLKEIILNSNERLIKDFSDIGIDATVIEILPKDKIDKKYFLLPTIDYIYEFNKLIDKDIYLIQNQFYFNSKIKKINTYEFTYSNIENNLSGNPIFLKDDIKVIGISKGNKGNNSDDYADFIGPIFNYFKNFEINKNEKTNKNENSFDNDTDLITLDHTMDKELESIENTDEQNDGNFINGKLEGSGKFIWPNGCYYIGQFKNGKRHGKGTIYYKNGNIMYEGDFVNNKKEGYGKIILKNGQYYIGQFKNGKMHGKGVTYYKNGNIMYEGDYMNDKFEGDGKFISKNGEYYIGQFKKGKRNGKGIVYYKNGNIKCTTNVE